MSRNVIRASSVDTRDSLRTRARSTRTCIALLLALAYFGSRVRAQEVWHDSLGTQSGDRYGSALCAVGDFDLDGVSDFAVGDPRIETPLVDAGRVLVRSGATGAVLREWFGPGAGAQFGCAIAAAGDLDADGTPDLFVGAFTWGPSASSRPGAVRAISGTDGHTLFEVFGEQPGEWYGASITALGDVNGDGRSDLAVGGSRYGDLIGSLGVIGRVQVLSGANGDVLYTLYGRDANSRFGAAVAAVGDVDLDGGPDLLIGAYGDSVNGDRTGFALVVSGANGATLHAISGEQQIMLFGEAVARAGDVDGDGHADFLVGAPNYDAPGIQDAGLVRLYSGATGLVLRSWTGIENVERRGSGLAGGSDIDLDGIPDILVASRPYQVPGILRVLSGASGEAIYTLEGSSAEDEFGLPVAWLGDLDADGRSEFGVGIPNDDTAGNNAGRVRVWRACSPPVAYCVGKMNSLGCTPAMTTSGTPSLSGADDFVVSAENVINGSRGMLIWSWQRNATPFGGGTLCVLPPLRRTPIVEAGGSPPGMPDCTGRISFAFTHAYAALQGFRPGDVVDCQVWSRDANSADGTGLSLSNALEVRWCP